MQRPSDSEIVDLAKRTGWGEQRLARHFGTSSATAQRALARARATGELPARTSGSNHPAKTEQPPEPEVPDEQEDAPTMPDGDTDSVPPMIFDTLGRGLVMSDIHCPYHDRQAVEVAIAYGKRVGVTHAILLGDCTDFYQASKFCKSGRNKTIAEELTVARQMLSYLRAQLPQARIVYKVGNHELRLEHFVQSHAKELEGLEELELRGLLRLDRIGAEIVAENQFIHYGHLNMVHCHELGKGYNPVGPARWIYNKTHACTLGAHFHNSSQYGAPDIRGELTTCWSLGCLCDPRPKYATVNNWNHGFAITTLARHSFAVDNKRILGGKVY